jgi:hypothetical protein
MVAELLIILPVLARPARARRVFESARAATDVPHRILFLCSPFDRAEWRACRKTGADVLTVEWQPGRGDWARKINHAYRGSEEPWLFLGADDLDFKRGWAGEAMAVAQETGCGVIGTNDLGNPRVLAGRHSTHPLVSRRYADELGSIDGPGEIVHEGYDHQYCDDELVLTAQRRAEWAFAAESVVEHLHPFFKKALMDATYAKATRETAADRRLFLSRRRLINSMRGAP